MVRMKAKLSIVICKEVSKALGGVFFLEDTNNDIMRYDKSCSSMGLNSSTVPVALKIHTHIVSLLTQQSQMKKININWYTD